MTENLASELKRHGRTFVLAALLATLLRAMIFETYYVPSESMLPTLVVGDHILVSKLSFGPRVPFTDWRLAGSREPERGDVVIFDLGRRSPAAICPVDRCPDYPIEGFVKRVIGMPGDIVEVRRGQVSVNGADVPVELEARSLTVATGESLRVARAEMNGRSHLLLDDPGEPGLDQVRIRVPDDRYFMMGDNRDNSNDSRSWGTVHRDQIVGPVTRVYWSWDNTETWLAMFDPLVWWRLLTKQTRWDRTWMRVH